MRLAVWTKDLFRHTKYEEQLTKLQKDQLEAFERDSQKALEAEDMSHREALLAAKPEAIV